MGVQFCVDCGFLLPITSTEKISCPSCGTVAENKLLNSEQITSSENFPSSLRNKLRSQTQAVSRKDIGDGPVMEVECPKCSNDKATWSEAQLRSADEGSTIFYCCQQCGHKWQENN